MSKKILISFIFVLIIVLSLIQAPYDVEETSESFPEVTSLVLEAENNEVEWDVEGYSSSGFKVVWSKNPNPEYPTRGGDKYNYHSSPEDDESKLDAFDGPGTYYVRVCEYLGGKCGLYSNEIEVVLGGEDSEEEKYEYKEKYEYEGENGEKINYEYEYEGKKDGFVPIVYGGDQKCSGCLIEGECVPICYRKSGVYCQLGGELVNQSEDGAQCDNSCECESNVCAGGECVSAGMIQKILSFFKGLFG